MSTPASKRSNGIRALLRLLQKEGKVAADSVDRIAQEADEKGVAVSELLEREGILTEKDLAVLLATTLRLRIIDLTSYPFDPGLSRELKEAVAIRYNVVPIRIDERTIEVATANPLDIDALKAVEFATGKRVQAVVATRPEISDALTHVYRLQESLDQFLQHVPDESLTVNELREEGGDLRAAVREAELPPVVKLADLILIEGIKGRASDVHIEPGTDAVAVRYRIDGILEESFRFPKWVQNALVARLKVMAKLDITERRVPQDGRIQLRYADRVVDLRVSSLPAQHGEKITLRILDATSAVHALDRVGLSPANMQRLRDAIRRPEGMILVTGPTGSGKTTTLYALLREKISPGINIVTIENPIEYQLKGINQVEVNEKQGLTFAEVLRSVLRQDPDVILVGEIRDKETAQIAFQAAQTGHLVLSTVHTNDAAAAVTRLIDLGIESYVIGAALNMVIAQRLVRRVCQACGAPTAPSEDVQRLLDIAPDQQGLRRGAGCNVCRQTGYTGRVGVYEVLPITPTIGKIIESGGTESSVRQQARREGNPSLLDDARDTLLNGLTTGEELMRVVQVSASVLRCPACRHDIDDEYTSCPHCGHVLRSLCVGCGKPLEAGWVTCAYCGASATQAEAASSPAAPAAQAPARTRSYKALVVDDNAALRDIVRITLERSGLGLTIMTAADGKQALDMVAAERPDIVLLDLQMPEIDGIEVTRRLRSDVRTAFVPVLMLTAQTGEESMAQAFAAGTDDYIVKPFRREDLVLRVRRMLERTYGTEGLSPAGEVVRAVGAAPAASEDPALIAPLDGEPAPAREPSRTETHTGAVGNLLAQVVADKGALGMVIQRLEERLTSLTARLDAEIAVRSDEMRKTLDRIRSNHERALAQLRGQQAESATEAMRATDEALLAIQEESLRLRRESEEALVAARSLITDLKTEDGGDAVASKAERRSRRRSAARDAQKAEGDKAGSEAQ
ncbi:MAG TPA: ATPase, T2SS/T4P/T4SS family [Candidatus Binatia bacterium]|jgi:type II secretory ATPase GspE/PulE/Tfp pilus assembly ATPase PilB-like protein/DNA-binding response OmpR family regulator